MGREGRLAEEVAVHRRAVRGQVVLAVRPQAGEVVVNGAIGGLRLAAARTLAAGAEGHDHGIAGGHLGHAGAHSLDRAGALVAEHHGARHGASRAGGLHVRMADTRGENANQSLALGRARKLQLLDRGAVGVLAEDGRSYLHLRPLERSIGVSRRILTRCLSALGDVLDGRSFLGVIPR